MDESDDIVRINGGKDSYSNLIPAELAIRVNINDPIRFQVPAHLSCVDP